MLQQSERARGSAAAAALFAVALASCAMAPPLADFEAQDWANARAIDTPAVYRDYLSAHARGPHAAAARARIETLVSAERAAWADARAANTEEAYAGFLARYRWSANAPDARARRAALAAPRVAVDETGSDAGVAHLRGAPGLRPYPDAYPDEARQAQAEVARGDDSAWTSARRLDQPREYERYLRQHPEGAHRRQAQQRINELRGDDRAAWDRAGLRDDLDAYQYYLNRYPDGEFRDEAQRRLSALRARELRLEPPFLTPPSTLPHVEVPAAPASPSTLPRPQMMEVAPFAAPSPPAQAPAPQAAAPTPPLTAAPADPGKNPEAQPERRRPNSP